LPDPPRALNPDGESMTLVVPAALVGKRVDFALTGLNDAAALAHGTATATIVDDTFVNVVITLSSSSGEGEGEGSGEGEGEGAGEGEGEGEGEGSACGNGNVDAGEECDGADLAGETCTSLGFVKGAGVGLRCAACAFDTSGCTGGSIDSEAALRAAL